jgi:hypothetical protein
LSCAVAGELKIAKAISQETQIGIARIDNSPRLRAETDLSGDLPKERRAPFEGMSQDAPFQAQLQEATAGLGDTSLPTTPGASIIGAC